ncbi:MAG TPA: RNA polymerase sigma-70 factor [Bacteroidales bacterium]|nr:RNA polymerase sigma-70 factor [Bacteroidales bacterium]
MNDVNGFYSLQDEAVLVKHVSKGDLAAFSSLYKIYSNRLYRFALGYLKSEEEAEELVQEVFTIIWEKRKELKEELSFKSFLFTIAFNIIKKHFRTRTQLSNYLSYKGGNDMDDNTTELTNYNSLKQYIDELVEQLPLKRKEIFIKSRYKGMSIMDIAREMNISHKTVENQITEALRFLRKHLNEENLPLALFFCLFIS